MLVVLRNMNIELLRV